MRETQKGLDVQQEGASMKLPYQRYDLHLQIVSTPQTIHLHMGWKLYMFHWRYWLLAHSYRTI